MPAGVGMQRLLRRTTRQPRRPTSRPTPFGQQVASGIDVLRGYDERHEEEEEAKHGAVLHVSNERISVRQV